VASNDTYDPNNVNDLANDSVSVINEANLTPTVTGPGGDVTAGGASFGATGKGDNNGYSDNHGGYSVNVPLPTDFVYVSGPTDCEAVTGGFTCSNTTGIV